MLCRCDGYEEGCFRTPFALCRNGEYGGDWRDDAKGFGRGEICEDPEGSRSRGGALTGRRSDFRYKRVGSPKATLFVTIAPAQHDQGEDCSPFASL